MAEDGCITDFRAKNLDSIDNLMKEIMQSTYQ